MFGVCILMPRGTTVSEMEIRFSKLLYQAMPAFVSIQHHLVVCYEIGVNVLGAFFPRG